MICGTVKKQEDKSTKTFFTGKVWTSVIELPMFWKQDTHGRACGPYFVAGYKYKAPEQTGDYMLVATGVRTCPQYVSEQFVFETEQEALDDAKCRAAKKNEERDSQLQEELKRKQKCVVADEVAELKKEIQSLKELKLKFADAQLLSVQKSVEASNLRKEIEQLTKELEEYNERN